MAGSRTRRPRDPEATREDILEAASSLLARQGPEAVSLSGVAKLAKVNRGTAYQHFETREKLIEATLQWVSDRMFRIAFGGTPEEVGERDVEQVDVPEMVHRLVEFAMENSELCRIWLLQLLASPEPTADPFWREYSGSMQRFADTELAQDGIDSEATTVMFLSGIFLWPVWAGSHAKSDEERAALVDRFSDEVLRLSMFGTMRPERHPALAERILGNTRVAEVVPITGRR